MPEYLDAPAGACLEIIYDSEYESASLLLPHLQTWNNAMEKRRWPMWKLVINTLVTIRHNICTNTLFIYMHMMNWWWPLNTLSFYDKSSMMNPPVFIFCSDYLGPFLTGVTGAARPHLVTSEQGNPAQNGGRGPWGKCYLCAPPISQWQPALLPACSGEQWGSENSSLSLWHLKQ